MWQPIKSKVLFVGSTDEKGRKIILLSTSLNLNPLDVIQAYVYRSSIEHTFWLSTQFFMFWPYRFLTKMFIIKSDLKGKFNLHFCNEKLRGIFYGKVRAYKVFLTITFLAHAMYLFLGIRLKDKKIDDNIIFFDLEIEKRELQSRLCVRCSSMTIKILSM